MRTTLALAATLALSLPGIAAAQTTGPSTVGGGAQDTLNTPGRPKSNGAPMREAGPSSALDGRTGTVGGAGTALGTGGPGVGTGAGGPPGTGAIPGTGGTAGGPGGINR
ncbi:hypothetical protein [Methylobacterium soli]|uniref:Collagen-like protein n=1 Tax=Methylobacterium soli TaxID=553447 RepID=A0A6L3SWQ2_9HYPH|nr:hypothetical protein [Methylobacterium soli]KAB1076586.1 hypothetical protein F6X53_23090 [Methylobacterium soli]